MGHKGSKVKVEKLTMKDFEALASKPNIHFSAEEIKFLSEKFKILAESLKKDHIINQEEFRTALGLVDAEFSDRIFNAFDKNGKNDIDFKEYVIGLSALHPVAPLKQKAEFCFAVFDIDRDGSITKDELRTVLMLSLREYGTVSLTDAQIEKVVDTTFAQMDHDEDNTITFDEFLRAAEANPAILNCVNLQLDRLLNPNE